LPWWRRTDLSAFAPADMHVVRDTHAGTVSGAVPTGVVVAPLATAVQSHAALIQQHLGSAVAAHTNKFAALNAATWHDGWFVYVPKNTVAEVPLHLVQGFGDNDTVVCRNVIVLERGAQLSLIEQYAGSGAIALATSEYILGDGATLNLVSMQTWDAGVRHLGHEIAKVGNDASARPWEQQGATFDAAPARSGVRIGSSLAGGAPQWFIPADFDVQGFVQAAKQNFIRLQAAWDRADIPELRAMMTDSMLHEIQTQLAERGRLVQGPNTTEVVMLEAQLLGIEDLGEGYMASVEFSGMIREEPDQAPSPFREVWNMTKPQDGSSGWLVAGVQALE